MLRYAVPIAILMLARTAMAGPSLQLTDCRISGPGGSGSAAAQCGSLPVPENRADPQGRTIELFVARVPALTGERSESAFTLLAGGPGQAASELYVIYKDVLERVRRSHDILLVDQRGTGASNKMQCEMPEEGPELSWDEETTREVVADCLQALQGDPRFYTTSEAVRDLDAVRAALGYERLDIYGGSYGTRVAQHYLRRYPEHTRSVVLDGVVAPDLLLGPGIAMDAQHALDEIFRRCREDQTCQAAFPDLDGAFRRLQQRLRESPMTVDMDDPLTGAPGQVPFRHEQFVAAVRLLSYRPQSVSLLPLLIAEADRGNMAPLAAQAIMAIASLSDSLAYGMHNSVMCAEDIPLLDLDSLDREALAATYLGQAQVDTLVDICELWPRGEADPDLHDPVTEDVPVLLLSGSADPVTPPRYAERAAASMPRARHLVGEGQGHGMLGVGCVPRLLADFLKDTDLETLDASCLQRLGPSPFFLDFNGPTP